MKRLRKLRAEEFRRVQEAYYAHCLLAQGYRIGTLKGLRQWIEPMQEMVEGIVEMGDHWDYGISHPREEEWVTWQGG